MSTAEKMKAIKKQTQNTEAASPPPDLEPPDPAMFRGRRRILFPII
jgi:hypothetical protein